MPTCPGCQQSVSYDRLDTHQRYCHGLRGSEESNHEPTHRLEQRVDALDRHFDRRVRALEEEVGNRPRQNDDEGDLTLLERDW